MAKRIAFVINQLGGIGSGGSDRVVSVLANEFVARGWAVDILALTGDDTIDRDLAPEITVRFERPIRSLRKPVQVALRMLRGAALVRSYVREHPEAVVVSLIAWVNMCTVAGTIGIAHGPVILSERTDPASDPSHPLARRLRNACYRRADALAFQTPDAQRYFARLARVPSEVIPNPVSPGLPVWEPAGGDVEIVTAARLEAEKNIPLLIDAFAPIARVDPRARLRVFGGGKLRQQLQDRIDAAGLTQSVRLEGHASDVHQRMSRASMFVMSSNFEGMPNALLEAMSMGMPVISVDCPIGGPRMLIDDGVNGVLVPVGDVTALSRQMQRLLDDPEGARALGERAADTREQHSIAHIADRWERLFDRVLGETSRSARV